MADDKTSADDLNIVRYFLCFLHFSANDFHEAGLLGEFVARRYPDSSGARQCAKIAMAAYLKLYVENTTDNKDFESRKVTGIANYIAQKWSDQPEAIDALNTLVPLMIKAGKLEAAEKYLNDIPARFAQTRRGGDQDRPGDVERVPARDAGDPQMGKRRRGQAGRRRSGRQESDVGPDQSRAPRRSWKTA